MKLKTQEAGASLTDPVLEIKKFKHHASLSEETEAFSGELYVDGKFFAEVRNSGQGGSHDIGAYGDAREMERQLEDLCRQMPNVPSEYTPDGLKFDLEFAITELVSLMVYRRSLKRKLSKKLGYQLESESYGPGEFHLAKLEDTPANRQRVEAKGKVVKWMNDEANAPVSLRISEIHAALCADSHGRS